MKKVLTNAALGVALGIGTLGITMTGASADIVCNDEGDCWHVKERYTYEPVFKVTVYPDEWKWEDKDKDRYRWREHEGEGRGYWRGGLWIGF